MTDKAISYPDEVMELAREMLAGLEGVTPGPWRRHVPDKGYCMDYIVTDSPAAKDERPHSDYVAETGNTTGPRSNKFFEKDAAHIARCSPENIRRLCDEVLAADRSRRDPGLTAEVERLREALREIVSPVEFIQRRAQAEGSQVDGFMAVFLSKDPEYLRRIARAALGEA